MNQTHTSLAQIDRLRAALSTILVGQEQASTAILVGVLAREHVLLEGAPGCGKSSLAGASAALFAEQDQRHLCAFHRDTRREDLMGDVHLRRRELANGAQRLSFELEPGALLRAHVVVLEDLARAPGEALAPLLQLLGSRTADLGRGAKALPLETAIATTAAVSAAAVSETHAVDPLEPSQLDRFALQVRMRGLVNQKRWRFARALMDRALDAGHADPVEPEPGSPAASESSQPAPLSRRERQALQAFVSQIATPPEVQQRVAEAVQSLAVRVQSASASTHQRALLSDRVFGAVLPKLLRAHAAVHGRAEVAPEDLAVLQLVIAQRLPEGMETVLEEVLHEAISVPVNELPPPSVSDAEGEDSLPLMADENNERVETDAMPGQVPGAPSTEADLPEAPPLPPRRRRPRPADVEPLIRAFEGRLDKGKSDLDDDPGGQPRGFRPMRRFDELIDADPLDALLLVDGTLAGPPRVLRRRRHTLGGAVVIARDVSSSMAGFRNDWASELICGLVRASARRRMRVGYLEFHQRAMPRKIGGRLLHRKYAELNEVVREARPMGQTNYEAPLRMALDALKGRRGRNRHVVMLTDGLPILGDTQVRAERALAQKLGVSLHTVFIGDGDSPPVLDAISEETGGLRFQAVEAGGALVLCERLGLVA